MLKKTVTKWNFLSGWVDAGALGRSFERCWGFGDRYGFAPELALLVKGSSRRITIVRFRPALYARHLGNIEANGVGFTSAVFSRFQRSGSRFRVTDYRLSIQVPGSRWCDSSYCY